MEKIEVAARQNKTEWQFCHCNSLMKKEKKEFGLYVNEIELDSKSNGSLMASLVLPSSRTTINSCDQPRKDNIEDST